MANAKKNKVKTVEVARAIARNVRVSPRKAKLMVDLVKGKTVDNALQAVRFSPKKTARITEKLLMSALASAKESGAEVDNLVVSGGLVNRAAHMKRFTPRAQGRASPILNRSAHITIVLGNIA